MPKPAFRRRSNRGKVPQQNAIRITGYGSDAKRLQPSSLLISLRQTALKKNFPAAALPEGHIAAAKCRSKSRSILARADETMFLRRGNFIVRCKKSSVGSVV
ncbi:hypothetical protein [Sphingomonas sp. SAFR-052]|uniref:hypothetical protein n=1 Tax=Sphingomonas sp. SAFR-052 TaxID=3436867 RepID=UPI003F7DF72B